MHSFPYDPFQEKAIQSILDGVSVFVAAPTGSGKTVIAEVAIETALASGGMAIYTAPIKALSNQKFRDFHAKYGEKTVGILTGDVTLNPDAPLLIMTTEIYRNSLLEKLGRFNRCKWVIFDEVHYLDDKERGTVWEEALMLTPRDTEILALSATVPNAEQIAKWIETTHERPVRIITEEHRPIPLKFSYQCQNHVYGDLEKIKTEIYGGRNQVQTNQSAFRMGRHRGGKRYFKKRSAGTAPPMEHRGAPNRSDSLIHKIQEQNNLPCIYFTFSRKRVEELAWEFAGLQLIEPEVKQQLADRFDDLCRRYEISHERSSQMMRELIVQGIAFHHAGLLPTLKEVVEVLFSSRLLKVIVTTETFALGVNMPARSVVLDTLLKRSNGPRKIMRVRDLSQMAGRAGRRGMDETGFVYLRINPWEVPLSELNNLLHGKPEEVSSRFSLTYSTLLNLYKNYEQDLLPFYRKTLHAYQSSVLHQKEAYHQIEKKLNLLQNLNYLNPKGSDERLSAKGKFAVSLYGHELMLSEFFEIGLLDKLNLTDLGILLIALIYEPRHSTAPVKLSRHLNELAVSAYEAVNKIHKEERRLQIFPHTKAPEFHLWALMERWIGGATLDKLIDGTDTDEGEIIRYLRMTLQLCRALSLTPAAGPALQEKAVKLMHRINRDQVDAEAELRRSL